MSTLTSGTDRHKSSSDTPTVSIVIPCLDEARTIGNVIDAAVDAIAASGVTGEVIVVDNGSHDGSQDIAVAHGARLIAEPRRGYGSALRRGCDEARGVYLIIGDADGSYDFSEIGPFLEALNDGADLVLGSRTRGTIDRGAMPWKNRYIGNPISTQLLNRLYKTRVSDVHCGLRALTADAYRAMELRTNGMEFASEMVIRAGMRGLDVREVPIRFRQDGRDRQPHLRPWRDGWRHLKVILLFSPTGLFLVPGIGLLLTGLALMVSQLFAPIEAPLMLAGMRMDFHWGILGSLLALVGYQVVLVALFAKLYAMARGISDEGPSFRRAFRLFTLERVLLMGSIAVALGAGMDAFVALRWLGTDLGPLVSGYTRIFVFGSTLIALGVQTIFSAFFLSILRDDYAEPQR
jgi:Glycosyl transferase family 2